MGWETSTRSSRLPRNWKQLRDQVRRRAGGQCEHRDEAVRCPLLGAECDHIIRGDDHRLSNLQWLCKGHHRQKTNAEARAARPVERRSRPKHPGLL